MQATAKLPDEERRQKLKALADNLNRALDPIDGIDTDEFSEFEDEIESAYDGVRTFLYSVEDQLEAIPRWDGELVKQLVMDNFRDAETRMLDWTLIVEFEVGDLGDETECRYMVNVGSGGEFFEVKRDGEYTEVWSN